MRGHRSARPRPVPPRLGTTVIPRTLHSRARGRADVGPSARPAPAHAPQPPRAGFAYSLRRRQPTQTTLSCPVGPDALRRRLRHQRGRLRRRPSPTPPPGCARETRPTPPPTRTSPARLRETVPPPTRRRRAGLGLRRPGWEGLGRLGATGAGEDGRGQDGTPPPTFRRRQLLLPRRHRWRRLGLHSGRVRGSPGRRAGPGAESER